LRQGFYGLQTRAPDGKGKTVAFFNILNISTNSKTLYQSTNDKMPKALLKIMILRENINKNYDGAPFEKLAQGASMS